MSLNKKIAWQVKFAAHVIRLGGVVAHPTEAVWGLACDPYNAKAVERLLAIKSRPVEKGLILVSGQPLHFSAILGLLSDESRARFFSVCDHPTTWLVPDLGSQVPKYVKGKFSSAALRLSGHDITSALSDALGHPIISTSANPAGREPAMSLFKVNQYFANTVDYILPGRLGGSSKPSEIRDLVSGDILRS